MAENGSQYKDLCRAQLSYDYLHTNSTTHEFLFGALAELLDNARDASATKINIYSVSDSNLRGSCMLCFLDDGQGMSAEEAADIVTFGKSSKKSLESQIGMYGNGLKSGSMRIGNDFILFTKKGPTMTCIFLSRTFHDEEGIDEIVVPMPSFDSQSKKPIFKSSKDKERHQLEMDLILKYSPFKTEAAFMKEFDKLEGTSGTLVNIYNLKLLDSGEPELDVTTDPFDIILTNSNDNDFDADERLVPERKSFRAYTSIMYVDPRMRVYIQGKKVRTQRLANSLYKPRVYKYSSARFKARSEAEVKKAQEESRIAENRAKEAESKARNLEAKLGNSVNKDQRAELRRIQTSAAELRKDAQIKKAIAERKQKALRDPKSLSFVFGINIESRNQDGIFVYNCSRLIKMYQKVGPQADGGVFCSGVVGFVDVPYLVLEPTHNKQDFADAKEYRHLLTAMGEHMTQYWKDINIASQGVSKFWESFGYISPNWRDPPSTEVKYVKKRAMQVQVTIQCDLCLKWRILPFSSNNIGKQFPDDWVCSLNSDPTHNRCSAPEEKLNMPEGVLKKVIKTKEDKERDLAEEIRKKQEQLDKLNKSKVASKPVSKKPVESEESEEESEEEESEEEEKPNNRQRGKTSPRAAAQNSRSEPPKRQPEPPKPKPAPPPAPSRAAPVRAPPPPPAKLPARGAAQKRGTSKEEESEEEEIPVKRRASAPAAPPPPANKSKPKKSSDDESESGDESGRATRGAPGKRKAPEPDDGTTATTTTARKPVISHHGAIGTRVEIKIANNWLRATVVEVNPAGNKWKVRQDSQATDKFDKWLDKTSPELRLVKMGKIDEKTLAAATNSMDSTTSVVTATSAQSSSSSPSTALEVTAEASSSSPGGTSGDIANLFRTCLRYFLPPQWVMDKEAVSNLSLQELSTFPLDDFFDYYERGLKKLVSGFQLEAQNKQAEAEHWKTKLSSLRKMIAKLLKSINDDFDIDQDTDTEQVDELLSLCVKQALQQGQGDDGTSS